MPLPTPSFYHIAYEPAPMLLRGTSLRTLCAEEVTESAELLLDTARQHGNCPYWLLDGRLHERPQPPALHHWMQEEYFPRVRTQLGQQACVAFLTLPISQQQATLAKAVLQEWQTPAVRMGWFGEEAAARVWLNHCRLQ